MKTEQHRMMEQRKFTPKPAPAPMPVKGQAVMSTLQLAWLMVRS